MQSPPDAPNRLQPLPKLIFASRWLQLPLYLGLIVAQCVYVFLFVKELVHLVVDANTLTEQGIMLLVLGLIDVVMISNLLVMVIVGGVLFHLNDAFAFGALYHDRDASASTELTVRWYY